MAALAGLFTAGHLWGIIVMECLFGLIVLLGVIGHGAAHAGTIYLLSDDLGNGVAFVRPAPITGDTGVEPLALCSLGGLPCNVSVRFPVPSDGTIPYIRLLELGREFSYAPGALSRPGFYNATNFEQIRLAVVRLDVDSASAVPEPTSWAMMIAGFGAIGAAMRRRKITARVSYATQLPGDAK